MQSNRMWTISYRMRHRFKTFCVVDYNWKIAITINHNRKQRSTLCILRHHLVYHFRDRFFATNTHIDNGIGIYISIQMVNCNTNGIRFNYTQLSIVNWHSMSSSSYRFNVVWCIFNWLLSLALMECFTYDCSTVQSPVSRIFRILSCDKHGTDWKSTQFDKNNKNSGPMLFRSNWIDRCGTKMRSSSIITYEQNKIKMKFAISRQNLN